MYLSLLVPIMETLFLHILHRDALVPLASALEQEGFEPQLVKLTVQLEAGEDRMPLAPLHSLVKLKELC